MKRLFLVLGIMVFAGLGLAGKSTVFNYKFPAYAAVFTNVDTVEFFTGNTNGVAGTLSDNTAYYEASQDGVVACIDANASSLPISYTINGSGSSDSLTCKFYPNDVVNSGFSVKGYTGLSPAATSDPDATDGELLVITNSSTFTVSSSVTSGSAPTDVAIKVFPGYQADSDKAVYGKGGSVAAQDVASFSADQTLAFDTDYGFAKVIPLVFFAEVDVLNTSAITSQTFTVTWNGSAP